MPSGHVPVHTVVRIISDLDKIGKLKSENIATLVFFFSVYHSIFYDLSLSLSLSLCVCVCVCVCVRVFCFYVRGESVRKEANNSC